MKKQLGFGCMRLPMLPGEPDKVDQAQFEQMIDAYMAAGFRYFDTAHVYLAGASERAIREGLVRRYSRSSFTLTDKLSGSCFQREADIEPLFQAQLDACGVEWFDWYLMHSQTAEVYEKFLSCNAYDTVRRLRDRGMLRHFGISFHDKPQVLERILTEQPDIEAVQIQLNYLDMDSPSIESRAVYEVCRKYNKPVFVMEPVKGGGLSSLPEAAGNVFDDLSGGSPASYAIRFAAGFDGVEVVLSGMSTLEQMHDNLSYMVDFRPLDSREMEAVEQVRAILQAENSVACTGCRYCVAGCPKRIPIPDLFACLNTKRRFQDWGSDYYYGVITASGGKASDCIHCGKCQRICPQHLPVPELLKEVMAAFDV